MQQNAVAVFVKTPGYSPVKTRLTSGIGTKKAQQFYEMSIKATAEMLRNVNAKIYWAVAEQNALDNERWQGFDRLHTGEGGLGERQDQVYRALRQYHHNVMLMGADCPQLPPDIIEDGFAALNTHDYAVGPAEDGGYYLLAGRQAIARNIWTGVTYSSDNTRADLSSKLQGRIHQLAFHSDVDEKEDLHKILRQMPEEPNEAQKKIIEWVKALEV